MTEFEKTEITEFHMGSKSYFQFVKSITVRQLVAFICKRFTDDGFVSDPELLRATIYALGKVDGGILTIPATIETDDFIVIQQYMDSRTAIQIADDKLLDEQLYTSPEAIVKTA